MSLALGCGGGGGGGDTGPKQIYTIGGTLSGLNGGGLVLTLNGGNDLSVSAGASSFTFAGKYDEGQQYFVQVKGQPSGPTQVCTAANGTGTIGNANVTNIAVTCTTNSYPLGGTVTGYTGTGLTLKLNDGAPQTITTGAIAFAFGEVPSGTNYAVTVGTQPTNPAQTCAVTNGSGTVGAAAVTNISVACVTVSYTIGGAIAGLTGTGLVLQNNGGNDLTVPASATSFSFSTPVNAGTAYNVTVKAQPSSPSQTCTVANGTGNAAANVTNVVVNCVTNSYTIGGTVSGLTGSGLSLLLNGASPLSVPAGATTFSFPGTVGPGASYAVTVAAHPAGQTCTLSSGTGTVGNGNVTTVAVGCTANAANTWTVGGTISGLTQTGLVLLLNGGSSLAVPAGASSFAFAAVPAATNYAVTVETQPTGQTCSVSNGSGTVGSANVTNVAVNCAVNRYTIGGTITGLVGTGLSLTVNGGGRVNPAAGATTFTFLGTYPTGTAYTAAVSIQPSNPTQQCTIANATGTVGTANIPNIEITCVTVYTLSGVINNNRSDGLVLLLNGSAPISRTSSQTGFSWALPAGTPYIVTVGTQPNAPTHTCTVSNGTGTMGTANVSNVVVGCIPDGPIVAGPITGYTSTGLTLRITALRNDVPLPETAPWTPQRAGYYTFPDLYQLGDEYSVAIATQPAGQTCTIRGAKGRIVPPDSNNPPGLVHSGGRVDCINNNTSPLSGVYSVLQGGKRQYLALWPDGTFTLAVRSDDATCSNAGNGVEYGVYNWNATTGAFNILAVAVDTDGPCGIWNPNLPGFSGTLARSGNDITLTTGDGPVTLSAVTSTASTIVGPWAFVFGSDGEFAVFQADNTYLIAETQVVNNATGSRPGYERACYAATATSVTANVSSSCTPDGAPVVDTNGDAGFSGETGPVPYSVTGPNALTIAGYIKLFRLLPLP